MSSEEDFERHKDQIKLWFLNREYPKRLTDTEVKRSNFRVHGEKEILKWKEFSWLSLTMLYWKILLDFAKILPSLLLFPWFHFAEQEKWEANLNKLYPLEMLVGSLKCNGKRCQVFLNVTESKTFSTTVTKKEYKI